MTNDPEGTPEPVLAFYWLESPTVHGWVGVDQLGKIAKAAEPLSDLLGKRLAHLPAEWSVVRLRGPIPEAEFGHILDRSKSQISN